MTAREELTHRELAPIAGRQAFTAGRLHELPDGRIVAVLAPPDCAGLLLQELDPRAKASPAPVQLALSRPPPTGMFFFTNTPRGGSKPSHELDLLAAENSGDNVTLRYLHVHLP